MELFRHAARRGDTLTHCMRRRAQFQAISLLWLTKLLLLETYGFLGSLKIRTE